MHIHDHRHPHLLAYQDKEAKALIRGIKLLDPPSLDEGARLLYEHLRAAANTHASMQADTYICMPILLLHAPSSAYANGERPIDQVLAMLQRVAALSSAMHIDVMPHSFILSYDQRAAQHAADRSARIANARTKFKILRKTPEALLLRYDRIYVIDDVSTTGHTLHALLELMKTSYPTIADRFQALSIAH